jgi:hypothetical protein
MRVVSAEDESIQWLIIPQNLIQDSFALCAQEVSPLTAFATALWMIGSRFVN